MSIRPIDLQTVIRKSDHYIKESSTNQQEILQQQHLSDELQKKAIKDQNQVVSTEPSTHKRVNNEEQRDKDSQKKKQKSLKDRDKSKSDKKVALYHEDKGVSIDIII